MLLKNSLREGVLYSMAHVYVGRDSSANMKVGGGGRWWVDEMSGGIRKEWGYPFAHV